MPEESIVEAVNRLEVAIGRLETLLTGDTFTAAPGLVRDVRQLQQDVQQLQTNKVSMWQWLIGFALFVGGVTLSNHAACSVVGVTIQAGLSFAVLLWAISAVFFLSGLGLIRWK
jgi:hypothetical protein